MLIVRCAWHSRYRGYPRLIAVASWRGRRLEFSDGLCPSCAKRVRAESLGRRPDPDRPSGTGRAAALFVGVPLAGALVLMAAPLSSPPPLPPLSARVVVPAVSALPERAVRPPAARLEASPAAPRRERVALTSQECADVPRAAAVPRGTARPRWIPAAAPPAAETSSAIWIPADAPRTWVPLRRLARATGIQTP